MKRRTFVTSALAAPFVARPAAAAALDLPVGQMLVTGFRGTTPDAPEVSIVRALLAEGSLAGVLLLGRNITSPEQVLRLTDSLRAAAGPLAPLIAIDQEGGAVSRLGAKVGFSDWLSARDMARSGMQNVEIRAYYDQRAAELAMVGINLNLAPVVDLAIDPVNPGIGAFGRIYSDRTDEVARHAALFIEAHRAQSVLTSLKHYPGHGSSGSDSHDGFAEISESWTKDELAPYRDLVRRGLVDTVMHAHLLHRDFSDAEGVPTSLSRRSIDILRREIGFDGAVISDSLQMKAITRHFTPEDAAVRAINAGNSLLIYSDLDSLDAPGMVKDLGLRLSRNPAVNAAQVEAEVARAQALRRRIPV